MPTFSVNALSLNLRTEPVVRPGTRVAVLPRGHFVTGIGSGPEGWTMVEAELQGAPVTGFVAHRFLTPHNEFEGMPSLTGVTEVHLNEAHPMARRDIDGKRAFPISEDGAPHRDVTATANEKANDLTEIVEWLDVENSERYLANGSSTFCNIYAHDFCYLARVYLPRVWWGSKAILKLEGGEAIEPKYAKSIFELNANSLFNWLSEFGPEFGWEATFDLTEMQDTVNHGAVGVICAQREELNRPGHICVVVPETAEHEARRNGDEVASPLQSQAGTTNRAYGTRRWWIADRFRGFGFWTHP